MNNERPTTLIFQAITAILLIFAIFQLEYLKQLRQEAVRLGFAEYNSTNAVWQWKTNVAVEVNK